MTETREQEFLAGRRVTVMGLGLHGGGISVVRWLVRHGARVTVTDLKTKRQLSSSIKKCSMQNAESPVHFVLGRHDVRDFRSADIVIQNPAVPRESPYLTIARKAGAVIENEATLFFKYCKSKNSIGVTGTRGKSTTAAMIAHILHKNTLSLKHKSTRIWFAGNIRTTPMLSIVDRIQPNDWVVLELSSWHLENMGEQKMSPHVAVVTNLLNDHLNRYRSKQSYARAKEHIVRHQKKTNFAVLNRTNPWTRQMAERTQAKIFWFSNYELGMKNYGIHGQHFIENAKAAAVTCLTIGISKSGIRSALGTFQGLPDRQEIVRVIHGVTYVNDTTATTPDATIAALRRFSLKHKNTETQKHIVLICGGADKNLNFRPLIPWIRKTCKAVVLLPGTATEKMKKLLPVTSHQLPVTQADSMRDAVRQARAQAERGDIVLLSPAAASFGLFQHEFDRGEKFRKYVSSY